MAEDPVKWRFNQLCILGAIIGLIALLLPWTWMQMGGTSGASIAYYTMHPPGAIGLLNAFDILSLSYLDFLFSSLYMSILILYILGTITAFISPIGGFIQIAGALLYIPAIPSELRFYWFVPFGELLGIYSGMIVVVSMLWPIGAGYADGAMGIRARLVTFRRSSIKSPAPSETGREKRSIAHSILFPLRRICISMKTLLLFLIPVILILAAFSYYVIAVPQPQPSYGWGFGSIATNAGSTPSTWTFTIVAIGGGGMILKTHVYVEVENQLGTFTISTDLLSAGGTHGFNYTSAAGAINQYLSVGDEFSLAKATGTGGYGPGSTIFLLHHDWQTGEGGYARLTVPGGTPPSSMPEPIPSPLGALLTQLLTIVAIIVIVLIPIFILRRKRKKEEPSAEDSETPVKPPRPE